MGLAQTHKKCQEWILEPFSWGLAFFGTGDEKVSVFFEKSSRVLELKREIASISKFMKRASTIPYTLATLLGILILILPPVSTYGQDVPEEESDWDRTFMPALQMGYVWHGTEELSGGLMTQTSIEYRDISNFIFRVNFDAFNSNMNLQYPVDSNVTFSGRTTFSELIIGVGYRQELGKHNLTAYVQPGIRFYGYPNFTTNGQEVNLDYDSRNVGLLRYSIGYEFALAPKLFLSIEGLLSHALKSKDFWADNPYSYGATIGVSAPLF